MSISVRHVERADFEAWLVLWEGYNAFYNRVGPTALPLEITDMTWGRFFDADEPVHGLVAQQNDQLVGLAHYLFHRSTTMISPTCYMQDLFTSEGTRGQGVGRTLIKGVYRQAALAGASRVYWHTQETNVTAKALYDTIAEDSGFVVYRKDL